MTSRNGSTSNLLAAYFRKAHIVVGLFLAAINDSLEVGVLA